MQVTTKVDGFTLVAYAGDAKTLLAFNLTKRRAERLAGFTIECRPHGRKTPPYFLHNTLRYKDPTQYAQVAEAPANSSVNSPFHKFRWVHVPGTVHQGLDPFFGPYTYVVTPRYFDGGKLAPLDRRLSAEVDIDVKPFRKGSLHLGFTRGYVQSQGFVNRFGLDAKIPERRDELVWDTSQVAGRAPDGTEYTYADQYDWLGFTARDKIFALLNEVHSDRKLRLDMFAYDLNEPDLLKIVFDLAKQGRVRLILDNAGLHHNKDGTKPEDKVEREFQKVAKAPAEIKRGKFGSFAHDKVLIVSSATGATKVLTGSTNFSITGLYVNNNHVLVFTGRKVAGKYADLFQAVWDTDVARAAYLDKPFATETFHAANSNKPAIDITFAPHSTEFAEKLLGDIATRVAKEGGKGRTTGNVLFAVMGIEAKSTVLDALRKVHSDDKIFSFGVSDDPKGISLYEPRTKAGVLVTGRPKDTKLPPPFNQVPGVGIGHQIHHKFVVCGFNSSDPVVYCGSSNLALSGEEKNGDNLLEIHDPDVVTAFAIEAIALVDHFQFLNRRQGNSVKAARRTPPASKRAAAEDEGWFLSAGDGWVGKYYDAKDLYNVDRQLFA